MNIVFRTDATNRIAAGHFMRCLTLTDTLFEVVEQAMKFIVSHISVAFEFDGSVQRKERFAYPLPAIREVLLNAIVHRSYTDPNDIQIKIFDDKITILSPCTFYGPLTVDQIQADNYRSSLRNKLIAEGFYLINVIEKYGSGFIRIRQALMYEATQGGMAVTVFNANDKTSTKATLERVNGGVNALLAYIQANPGRRASELANALNTPLRSLERWLKQLKENGQIEFRGAAKTGGYYSLDAEQ